MNIFKDFLAWRAGSKWHDIKRDLRYLIEIGEDTMATVQEVKDAVAAEAAEVKARLDALQARIDELIAQGSSGATPEQLEEIKTLVQGIFTPAP